MRITWLVITLALSLGTSGEVPAVEVAPTYLNGEWTLETGCEPEITWDELGNGWLITRVGEGTLGYDYLWRLGADGGKRIIVREWSIADLKVYGGKCYYLSNYMHMPVNDVYQVDGESGRVVRLGDPDYVYNMGLERLSSGGYFMNPHVRLAEWRVDAEGVWAVGMPYGGLVDWTVYDEVLAREGYGLYRLYPGGHELVEKYDLPE